MAFSFLSVLIFSRVDRSATLGSGPQFCHHLPPYCFWCQAGRFLSMYQVKLPDTVNPQSNSYCTCIKSALHHTYNKDIFDAVSPLVHAPKSKLSPRPVCLKACFHDQVSQQTQEHQTAEALKTTAQKADFLLQKMSWEQQKITKACENKCTPRYYCSGFF